MDVIEKSMGYPEDGYAFAATVEPVKVYDYPEFSCEAYTQVNGPGTVQRVMMLVPKNVQGKRPAVAVPFYFPEAMLGEEPETHEALPFYAGIEMMLHLVKRGYITISAEAYHLTYVPELKLERGDFKRWPESAAKLKAEHPHWTGIGKLVADTRLLIDMLCADSRVDDARIGIAGHSLGGKMAFYTGCLDNRIKAILASDFGMCWKQTNWDAEWYWGQAWIDAFLKQGIDHSSLLINSGCKPLALIAGEADNENSLTLLRKAGYATDDSRLCFINHATGHRPPQWALEKAYDFLDSKLK